LLQAWIQHPGVFGGNVFVVCAGAKNALSEEFIAVRPVVGSHARQAPGPSTQHQVDLSGTAAAVLCCAALQAKELVMRSLPVPESVLKRHCEAVAPIFAKKKMQTLQVGAQPAAAAAAPPGLSCYSMQ
jgi:hypothetical protein